MLDYNNKTFNTLEELKQLEGWIAEHRAGYEFYYRGHANANYQLICSAAREMNFDYERELCRLHRFENICSFLHKDIEEYHLPNTNRDLFFMGIMRHLGLPCLLLDWTPSLRTAISFASMELPKVEGSLWIMIAPTKYALKTCDPFIVEKNDIKIINEPFQIPNDKTSNSFSIGIKRRLRQCGRYTITSYESARTPLDELTKHFDLPLIFYNIIISPKLKNEFCSSDYYIPKSALLGKKLSRVVQNIENKVINIFI